MKDSVKEILLKVQNGELSADDALLALKKQPFEDLGYAHVDYHRKVRQGTDEVVYGSGKPRNRLRGLSGICFPTG